VSGVIEAANEAEARSQIRERGYYPTSIKEAKEKTSLFQKKTRLKAKHLALFCASLPLCWGQV